MSQVATPITHRAFPAPPSHAVEPAPALTPMCAAVGTMIERMNADLMCEQGIDGLAKETFYSKFHLTREFVKRTGTTPRRFLAALRMQEAKRMLLTSGMGVADVCTTVGFSSVGTFSSRFTQLVGVSPKLWRQCEGVLSPASVKPGTGAGQIHGTVSLPDPLPNQGLYVAAFADTIVQGPPVAATLVSSPGHFVLDGVPAGTWTVVALTSGTASSDSPVEEEEIRGYAKAVAIEDAPNTRSLPVRLSCRRVELFDPPVVYEGVAPASAAAQALPLRQAA